MSGGRGWDWRRMSGGRGWIRDVCLGVEGGPEMYVWG